MSGIYFIPQEPEAAVSVLNSFTGGTMLSNSGFTGTSESVLGYTTVSVSFYTPIGEDVNGTAWFEMSKDNINFSKTPIDLRDSSSSQPIIFIITNEYFRLRFENGKDSDNNDIPTTSASTFQIQTMYAKNREVSANQQIGNVIRDDYNGIIVKSVITGRNRNGRYVNSPVDTEGHIYVNIHDPKTSFGEIRTAQLTPVTQAVFTYGINTDIINSGSTSGGTVTSSDSMAIISTTASANKSAQINSVIPLRYSPGQGALVRFTTIYTSGQTGSNQYMGAIDSEDGFAFMYSGDTFGVVRRKDGIDYFTPQNSWNQDTMDGTSSIYNPSTQLLDPTKGNVYQIGYQFLGFGAITYALEVSDTGLIVPVHIEKYSNNNLGPSVLNPTLPITMHCENISNTSNIVMKTASISGFVEGERILVGPTRAIGNSKNPSTNGHIFSIRNKETFGGRTNKIRIFLQIISASADGASAVSVDIYKNASGLNSVVWVDVNTNNSPVSYSTSNATVVGTNILFSTGLAKSDSGILYVPEKFMYEVQPGDTISVVASGNNAEFRASITWIEDI